MHFRLSKAAGTAVTDNNPYVTNLSDVNRPDKLGEKFKLIYDDQWTDAFSDLTDNWGVDEKEACTILLDLIKVNSKIKFVFVYWINTPFPGYEHLREPETCVQKSERVSVRAVHIFRAYGLKRRALTSIALFIHVFSKFYICMAKSGVNRSFYAIICNKGNCLVCIRVIVVVL